MSNPVHCFTEYTILTFNIFHTLLEEKKYILKIVDETNLTSYMYHL